MAGVVRDWRDELVDRHPALFRRDNDNPKYGPLGRPSVGDGWQDLIERACAKIQTVVDAAPEASVRIDTIKQKFGGLRLYWSGHHVPDEINHAIEEAVALAEARSVCSCETCGAPGRLFKNKGWLATACDLHAVGDPVPVRAGWDNLLVVWRVQDGKLRVASCRRYDRETDSFTDVDPSELDTEE